MCFTQMSIGTCAYVLEEICTDITKVNLVGDTIEPEIRLAITLTWLCRGVYFYTIAQLYDVGKYGEQTYNIE